MRRNMKILCKIRGLRNEVKVLSELQCEGLPVHIFFKMCQHASQRPDKEVAWLKTRMGSARQIYRPDSVYRLAPAGNHSSGHTIAGIL